MTQAVLFRSKRFDMVNANAWPDMTTMMSVHPFGDSSIRALKVDDVRQALPVVIGDESVSVSVLVSAIDMARCLESHIDNIETDPGTVSLDESSRFACDKPDPCIVVLGDGRLSSTTTHAKTGRVRVGEILPSGVSLQESLVLTGDIPGTLIRRIGALGWHAAAAHAQTGWIRRGKRFSLLRKSVSSGTRRATSGFAVHTLAAINARFRGRLRAHFGSFPRCRAGGVRSAARLSFA